MRVNNMHFKINYKSKRWLPQKKELRCLTDCYKSL